jgi:SAM-dependent methyltransferase
MTDETLVDDSPFGAAMRAHAREHWPQHLGMRLSGETSYTWFSTAPWFGQDRIRERVLDEVIRGIDEGPVLDVGTGAGRAALRLQEKGIEVVAIDVEPACVDIARARGVEHAHVADIWTFQSERRFKVILFLDSTFGLVGKVDMVPALMSRLESLLADDGRVIVQDAAVAPLVHEMEGTFDFRGRAGKPFKWLNFSMAGLRQALHGTGWRARRLFSGLGPYFIAELRADGWPAGESRFRVLLWLSFAAAAVAGYVLLG